MDIDTTQPVIGGRLQIVENEILTISRILPDRTRGGKGKERWLAHVLIEDDTLQTLAIWHEEIKLFTDAGYPRSLFENREPVTVNIQVLPRLKYGVWHVGTVYAKDAGNGVVVLSSEERLHQWGVDVETCKGYQQIGITAWFIDPRGGSISWRKNLEGTYTRQAKDDIRTYAAKDPEAIAIEVAADEEAWIKSSMPAKYREIGNVADLRVNDVYARDIAKEDATTLETPQEREISAYTPDSKPAHLSTARYVDCDGRAHDVLILETFKYLVNVAYFDDKDMAHIHNVAYRELAATDSVVELTVKRARVLNAVARVMSACDEIGKRWDKYGRRR